MVMMVIIYFDRYIDVRVDDDDDGDGDTDTSTSDSGLESLTSCLVLSSQGQGYLVCLHNFVIFVLGLKDNFSKQENILNIADCCSLTLTKLTSVDQTL